MKLVFNLFFLGLFLVPFYFFKSGMPQVSHFLIILSFIRLFILEGRYNKIIFLFGGYKFYVAFILWSSLIGIIFFILYGDYKTLISPFYFLFNFVVMYMIVRLYFYDKNKTIIYLFNTLFYSILLLFVIDFMDLESFFHSGKTFYRKVLTFNNPNQLGYWTLTSATILFVLKIKMKKTTKDNIKFFISIILLLYLSMISLSKASSISILILLLLNSFKNYKFIVMTILIGYLLYLPIINSENDNFVKRFEKRLNDVGDASDDNLEGRGYLRIIEYPEYIFFGAGEGATEIRFNTPMEIHSTFGTILFSYGIIGFILFILFLYMIYEKNKLHFFSLLMPILLYGIAHMGLRFTFFWVALSIFIVIFTSPKKSIIKMEV